MKLLKTIVKITTALAAVAGIAYLVYQHMDTIKAWLKKFCPCCEVELEEDFVPAQEITPDPETDESAAVQDTTDVPEVESENASAPAQVEESLPEVSDAVPTAEEQDFEL